MAEKDSEDVEKLLRPVINACYPGTLSALNLTVLQVLGKEAHSVLRLIFSLNALLFLSSALFVFFYTIYIWKKGLWTFAAITFILGLFGSVIATIWLIIA